MRSILEKIHAQVAAELAIELPVVKAEVTKDVQAAIADTAKSAVQENDILADDRTREEKKADDNDEIYSIKNFSI